MQAVLLRGLGREARHWGEFPRLLSSSSLITSVKAIDLPGFGILSNCVPPLSIEQTIDLCRNNHSLPTLRKNEARVLVAISLGGVAAIDWILRYPNDWSGCVVINTSLAWSRPWQRIKLQAAWQLLLTLCSQRSTFEQTVLGLVSNSADARSRALPLWLEIQRTQPFKLQHALRQVVASNRYRPTDRKPAIPLLVVRSEADRLVSSACSDKIALKWGLAGSIHSTAGHDIPLDDPDWLASTILAFARTIVPRPVEQDDDHRYRPAFSGDSGNRT